MILVAVYGVLYGAAAISHADSVGDTIGNYLRSGSHNMTAYDWEQNLRFANCRFIANQE